MARIVSGISLVTLLGAVLALPACGGDRTARGDGAITEAVESDLVQLREEEKLARDVYLTLFDVWGTDVFDKISGAEQRHMNAVKTQLDAFGIPDPIFDDTIGVFTDPDLGALYTQLAEQGQASELAALGVGATIEDLDIYDIDHMMSRTDDEGILGMYTRLRCGSGNHMRAFTSRLADQAASYEPQFISVGHFDEILAADHERCGRH